MTIADQLRAEGLATGLTRGLARALTKQMTLKFGALSAEHAVRIQAASEQELDRYIERILTAPTAEAVFESPLHDD
jgi:hypothetical protein